MEVKVDEGDGPETVRVAIEKVWERRRSASWSPRILQIATITKEQEKAEEGEEKDEVERRRKRRKNKEERELEEGKKERDEWRRRY